MLDPGLRSIAEAQVERLRLSRTVEPPELARLIARAVSPGDVRQALLKERPVLDARRSLRILGPDPQDLREEAHAAGVLDANRDDLSFRRLFPSLDLGVYCGSHSTGKPSVALMPALEEAVGQLGVHGLGAWMDGGWLDAVDAFRRTVAELCGADLLRGDVAWYPNFSESLSAVLSGLSGKLLTDAGHFTSATYIHRAWAERTGNRIVEVPCDALGCVPTERLVDAMDADTAIVSISHALWRTGCVHDLDVLGAGIAAKCPDAVLLLDVYQTCGTVPIELGPLPMRTAILGGGVKQLRAGPGAGFAWVSHPLLELVDPARTGWWAHRDPMAFDVAFAPGPGAALLRTGTPDPLPMIALVTEARVLASSAGGNLRDAIRRSRAVTHRQVVDAVRAAEEAGLEVTGPRQPKARAAFFAVRVPDGPGMLSALHHDGVIADFRADRPGVTHGLVRVGANPASFGYELLYAVDRIAHHLRNRH
jgi:kynureninase